MFPYVTEYVLEVGSFLVDTGEHHLTRRYARFSANAFFARRADLKRVDVTCSGGNKESIGLHRIADPYARQVVLYKGNTTP